MVLITAPYHTSVERICARDSITAEMARRRLDAQTPMDVLRQAASIEIVNDGTAEQLESKVKAFCKLWEGRSMTKKSIAKRIVKTTVVLLLILALAGTAFLALFEKKLIDGNIRSNIRSMLPITRISMILTR